MKKLGEGFKEESLEERFCNEGDGYVGFFRVYKRKFIYMNGEWIGLNKGRYF